MSDNHQGNEAKKTSVLFVRKPPSEAQLQQQEEIKKLEWDFLRVEQQLLQKQAEVDKSIASIQEHTKNLEGEQKKLKSTKEENFNKNQDRVTNNNLNPKQKNKLKNFLWILVFIVLFAILIIFLLNKYNLFNFSLKKNLFQNDSSVAFVSVPMTKILDSSVKIEDKKLEEIEEVNAYATSIDTKTEYLEEQILSLQNQHKQLQEKYYEILSELEASKSDLSANSLSLLDENIFNFIKVINTQWRFDVSAKKINNHLLVLKNLITDSDLDKKNFYLELIDKDLINLKTQYLTNFNEKLRDLKNISASLIDDLYTEAKKIKKQNNLQITSNGLLNKVLSLIRVSKIHEKNSEGIPNFSRYAVVSRVELLFDRLFFNLENEINFHNQVKSISDYVDRYFIEYKKEIKKIMGEVDLIYQGQVRNDLEITNALIDESTYHPVLKINKSSEIQP